MNKSKSIKLYCLECGGGERSNSILCHITDCPLWEHRIGTAAGSVSYIKRITAAWEFYREARESLEGDGLTIKDLLYGGRFSPKAPSKRGGGFKKGQKMASSPARAVNRANAPSLRMTAKNAR